MTITIDFNKPATTDNYSTAFVPGLQSNVQSLGAMLDPNFVTTVSNAPAGTKRLNTTSGLFEQWNGTAWVANGLGYLRVDGSNGMSGDLVFASSLNVKWKDGGGVARAAITSNGSVFWFGDTANAVSGSTADLRANAQINFLINAVQTMAISAGGIAMYALAVSTSNEALRLANNNGFISFYNTANSVRTGYIQGTTGGGIVISADGATGLGFNTSGSARLTISSTGIAQFSGTTSGNGLVQIGGVLAVTDPTAAYLAQITSAAGISTISAFSAGGQSLGFNTTPSGGSSTQRMAIDTVGNSLFSGGVRITGAASGLTYTSSSGLIFQNAGAGPEIIWTNAGGATDSKLWDVYASTTGLNFRAINDANSVALSWLTVTRNATTSLSLAFLGNTTFAGGVATTPAASVNSGTAISLDWSKSNVFAITMTGNVASGATAFSNPSDGQTINVFLTQDGTGSRTLAFSSAFKWPNGVAGVLSTAVNAVDLLVITYRASTGFYYCTLTKGFA